MNSVFEQQATILDFELEGEQCFVISNRFTGDVLYEVDRLANSPMTLFRRPGQTTPFAVYQHYDLLPDKIAFSDRDPKPLKAWLKMKKTSLAATLKENGKEYTWMKGNNGPFNLVSEVTKKRIACFRRQQRTVIDGVATITPPYIALDMEAEEIMDAVIISAIVLEQSSRWVRRNDEWSMGKASIAGAALAGPAFAAA